MHPVALYRAPGGNRCEFMRARQSADSRGIGSHFGGNRRGGQSVFSIRILFRRRVPKYVNF